MACSVMVVSDCPNERKANKTTNSRKTTLYILLGLVGKVSCYKYWKTRKFTPRFPVIQKKNAEASKLFSKMSFACLSVIRGFYHFSGMIGRDWNKVLKSLFLIENLKILAMNDNVIYMGVNAPRIHQAIIAKWITGLTNL